LASQDWLKFADENIRHGLSYPGVDCFIIHSSVLVRFHFGDLFLGFPPWGNKVHVILSIMADNYINIPSNIHGTFHLGNDKTWETPSNKALNVNTMSREQRFVKQHFCPGGSKDLQSDYYTQNKINCGYLFRPVRDAKFNRTVPAFVKPGYESIFLQNYHRIIAYGQETGHYHRLDIGKEPKKNQPISKGGMA
jgi:hypothetical protein